MGLGKGAKRRSLRVGEAALRALAACHASRDTGQDKDAGADHGAHTDHGDVDQPHLAAQSDFNSQGIFSPAC